MMHKLVALATLALATPAMADVRTIGFNSAFVADTIDVFTISGEPGIVFQPASTTFVGGGALRVRYEGAHGSRTFSLTGAMDRPHRSLAFDLASDFGDEVFLAQLTLHSGGTDVGSTSRMYRTGLAGSDRLGWSGTAFDGWRLTLTYLPPRRQPGLPGSAMILDNFRFADAAAVPEPASWLMLIAGFGATGVVLRRRARQGIAFD